MVSDNVTQILHKAIQIYNPLVDKDYLIICSINKNHPSDYYAIRIKKDNFWHLLGCRANVDSDEVYNLCLIGKDIKMFLNYTNNEISCLEKYKTFSETFDFVNNAKILKVCDVFGTPEEFQFKLASGNDNGYIGYDKYRDNSPFHYPKTARNKPLSTLSIKNQKKIQAVLSKNTYHHSYTDLEYEIGKGIYNILRPNIPPEYNVF